MNCLKSRVFYGVLIWILSADFVTTTGFYYVTKSDYNQLVDF